MISNAARTCVFPAFILLVGSFGAARSLAQETPSLVFEQDCETFAIAPDNSIACAVPHVKRFEKIVIERDELWVASAKGGNKKMIVEPDKFMPTPPPATYIIESLLWSSDSQRLAVSMTVKTYPWAPKVKGKKRGSLDDDDEDVDNTEDSEKNPGVAPSGTGKVLALLTREGDEIKVKGSKSRFIEGAISGAWLADNKTAVYLTGDGRIMRVSPDDGKSSTLFNDSHFTSVAWDTQRNRAFAVGEGISATGRQVLESLDLARETVTELGRVDSIMGGLSVSPSGTAVGYYVNGDTIEVKKVADPTHPAHVRAGFGRFEFDRDERRILLKRGSADKSNDLIWVRIDDGDFSPILHDLLYHDFHISPDGKSVGVTDPGKSILRIYPLE